MWLRKGRLAISGPEHLLVTRPLGAPPLTCSDPRSDACVGQGPGRSRNEIAATEGSSCDLSHICWEPPDSYPNTHCSNTRTVIIPRYFDAQSAATDSVGLYLGASALSKRARARYWGHPSPLLRTPHTSIQAHLPSPSAQLRASGASPVYKCRLRRPPSRRIFPLKTRTCAVLGPPRSATADSTHLYRGRSTHTARICALWQ